MDIRTWSIRTRLLLAFIGVLIPYLALVGVGGLGVHALLQHVSSIYGEVETELRLVSDAQLALNGLDQAIARFSFTGSVVDRAEVERRVAQFREVLLRLKTGPFHDPEERRWVETATSQGSDLEALAGEILGRASPETPAGLRQLHDLINTIGAAVSQIGVASREMSGDRQQIAALVRRMVGGSLWAAALSVAGGVAWALLFSNWLSRPLREIADTSRRMAAGDLSQRVDASIGGELGETAKAFNAMAERLEGLLAVGRDLAESLDLDVVGQRITDNIRQLLRARFSFLYKLEPESGDLVAIAVSGDVHAALSRLPPGTGAVGLAIRERRPVASEDGLTDPRITVTPALRAWLEQTQLRAVLAVPLLSKDRLIGALVAGDQAGRVFSGGEMRVAQAFADHAALAFENARLFDETQRALADLKVAQEQLVQDATMRALGELASGAAHHLNNLLAVVLGRVGLLLSREESAPMRRPLEIIQRAARDAAEVVRRVSRFAQMRTAEDRQPVDLKQLAAEVLEMTRLRWQDTAQAQGLQIEVSLEGPDVPLVTGDAAALREVLVNLVLNAVDALPSGGQIVLRTFHQNGWVGVAVTDTGVGMSREVQERALKPFFTTKGPGGRGLGLSVAYGILQQHRGELIIESIEGQGTTVTVRLPVGSSRDWKQARTEAECARPEVSALRILIIDDENEVRSVMADRLATQSHKVLQADRGRQGLALLDAGEAVDLVLTDLGMPEMTGWEVARAIKARWPALPVGILTGWGDQMDHASADRRIIAGILSKPVTPEDLQKFVAACHRGS